MGRHNKRVRSSSSSSSDSEDETPRSKRSYSKKLKRKNSRIAALKSYIRDLRQKQVVNNNPDVAEGSQISDEPCSTIVLPETPSFSADQEQAPVPVYPSFSADQEQAPVPVYPNFSADQEQAPVPVYPSFSVPNGTIQYVGRHNFPEFNPETTLISVTNWIFNLESIAHNLGWDEHALLCNCVTKLAGYAKVWFQRQSTAELSWPTLKAMMIQAFPVIRNKLYQIRDLVNRMKGPNEDTIKFYYEKLGIGMSCNLSDEVITEIIIGTIGNNLIELGAMRAGCMDSSSLLTYLGTVNSFSSVRMYPNVQYIYPPTLINEEEEVMDQPESISSDDDGTIVSCFNCGVLGHKATSCETTSTRVNRRCNYCQRLGHAEVGCYKKRNINKYCPFCKLYGHGPEDCQTEEEASEPEQQEIVQTIYNHPANEVYLNPVYVNGCPALAFVDYSSRSNTMKRALCVHLQLGYTPIEPIALQRYGYITQSEGTAEATVMMDGTAMTSVFHIVQDDAQNFDILIGGPFADALNTDQY